MNGVLVVDKPAGLTSHDVVQRVRRALGTRQVGHTGTLDPMATGVLVVAVGEATKLTPHLTASDKEYEAEVTLGTTTDTLDSEGSVTETCRVPSPPSEPALRRVLQRFEGRYAQRAPDVSAIKVRGRPLYERVRRGEEVEAPLREVQVHALELVGWEETRFRVRVRCSKGFYVRSLARDLAEALGTVGHLSALRRTRSGSFGVEQAVPYELVLRAAKGEGDARGELEASLGSLEVACQDMPRVRLTDQGCDDAWHGRPVAVERLADGTVDEVPPGVTLALMDPSNRLIALAERREDVLRVVRGIRQASRPRPSLSQS